MAKFGIGQAMTRREDQRLLFGTGQYVDDVAVANEVFVAFVRSPHAHARVVSIDAKSAKSMPGVVAVLTGADLKTDGIGPLPDGQGLKRADGKEMCGPPHDALVLDTARFKYPPHWIPVELLYSAMTKADPATDQPRGWLLLRR